MTPEERDRGFVLMAQQLARAWSRMTPEQQAKVGRVDRVLEAGLIILSGMESAEDDR